MWNRRLATSHTVMLQQSPAIGRFESLLRECLPLLPYSLSLFLFDWNVVLDCPSPFDQSTGKGYFAFPVCPLDLLFVFFLYLIVEPQSWDEQIFCCHHWDLLYCPSLSLSPGLACP